MDQGHNMQALEFDRQAELSINDRLAPSVERLAAIEKGLANEPDVIETENTAESITTIIAQLQALVDRIELNRKDVKQPFLGAGDRVDSIAGRLRMKAEGIKTRLNEKLTGYQNAKLARIAAERAAERQREIEDPEPSFVPHAVVDSQRKVQVRSVEGARAHLTENVDITVTDVRLVPERYLNRPSVIKALISEMRSDVRKGDEIPGIDIKRFNTSRVSRG